MAELSPTYPQVSKWEVNWNSAVPGLERSGSRFRVKDALSLFSILHNPPLNESCITHFRGNPISEASVALAEECAKPSPLSVQLVPKLRYEGLLLFFKGTVHTKELLSLHYPCKENQKSYHARFCGNHKRR